eukprot:scaffold114802_cov39-Phaeocystis_antarctica.AAC.1
MDNSLSSASASSSWRVSSFRPFLAMYACQIFTPLSFSGVVSVSATSTSAPHSAFAPLWSARWSRTRRAAQCRARPACP